MFRIFVFNNRLSELFLHTLTLFSVFWRLRCLHLHDVRVDHLVSVQFDLWDGHTFSRALCETVSRWRLSLHPAHGGDWELCGQRRVLWVFPLHLWPVGSNCWSIVQNSEGFTPLVSPSWAQLPAVAWLQSGVNGTSAVQLVAWVWRGESAWWRCLLQMAPFVEQRC